MTQHEPVSDVEIERQIMSEYAAALEFVAREYRRACASWGELTDIERQTCRTDLRGVTRRSIGCATLALAILEPDAGNGVKEQP
jgi:hypothetical protein